MNIKPNDIVALSTDKKILVIDLLKYMDRDFIFANEILPDESSVTNNYKIMLVDYNKNALQKVTNIEILSIILPMFYQRIQRNY